MNAGAQLTVPDLRRSTRLPVDHTTIAEHLTQGEMELHICNISTNGFMIDRCSGFGRGHRLIVRLPVVRRIEAYCIWTCDERAGFQFERIIRLDEFASMVRKMQPRAQLRRPG